MTLLCSNTRSEKGLGEEIIRTINEFVKEMIPL
jgi:hypothetical protein